MANVAFIGLGVMGFPMAGHLAVKGGHRVVVYNRTATRSAEWLKRFNGVSAGTPAEAARDAEVVFTCVGNDEDLRSVTLGAQGCLQSLAPGAVLVDHTTASAAIAQELDRACQVKGCHFMDAPVSGGQSGAENGTLSVMCGAEAATFDRIQSLLSGSYAAKIGLMGPVGSGQLAKMVNQICIAGVVQGLAEGLHFAHKAGLNIEKLVDVISQGAAGSWQMRNRSQTMSEGRYDFGFAVNWMRKDLGLALDEATRNGAALPVTALVNQFYREVQTMGGGRWDTSSLLARLER
jgi:3-hydroxyisobutyrate dehydrogenase-like beta-hydroxyacid dehydrogenase